MCSGVKTYKISLISFLKLSNNEHLIDEVTPSTPLIVISLHHELERVHEEKKIFKPSFVAAKVREYFNKSGGVVVFTSPYASETWNVYLCVHSAEKLLSLKKQLPDPVNVCWNILKVMREKIVLRGVKGIKNIHLQKSTIQDMKEEFDLIAEGTSMYGIAICPGIDFKRTHSNNIYMMYETFGIEVTTTSLFRECSRVLGTGVSARHIMLMVDAMTFDGYLNSVNRHGMGRTRATPIQRASFEEALDVLIEACTYTTDTKIKGITECIVTGTEAKIGTAYSDVFLEPKQSNLNAARTNNVLFVGRQKKQFVGRKKIIKTLLK